MSDRVLPDDITTVPEPADVLTIPASASCLKAVSYTHLDVYKRQFLLLLQLLLGAVLIVRVLGQVGGGFLIPGNLRVFLLECFLCFLEKYLLVLFIDRLRCV